MDITKSLLCSNSDNENTYLKNAYRSLMMYYAISSFSVRHVFVKYSFSHTQNKTTEWVFNNEGTCLLNPSMHVGLIRLV